MTFAKLLFFIFIPIITFSQKPYDTSTPEKLVEAMGSVGNLPADENPLPYLYDEQTANTFIAFDEIGEKAGRSFDQFRRNLQEKFPKYVLENKEGKIKITLNGLEENTRTFSFAASSVSTQTRAMKPTDFKFISATEPDENQISKLRLVTKGEENIIDIKKTEKGYKMFLTPGILAYLSQTTESLIKRNQVFEEANQLLESGEITTENFESEMERISIAYIESLQM